MTRTPVLSAAAWLNALAGRVATAVEGALRWTPRRWRP